MAEGDETLSEESLVTEIGPVKRSRVHDEIVEQLTALIREGRLKPGDRLPPERQLADAFRVSRTSVRSAFRVLELMGLIASRQGNGTYVAQVSPEALVTPLAAILTTQRHAIQELMDVRQMLEPPIAARAALRAGEDDVQELGEIVERQRARVEAGEPGVEEDTAFHYALAVACKNGVILQIMDLTMNLLRETRSQWLQGRDRAAKSVAGHERVLRAVQARDPEAARRAMQEHIEEIAHTILDHLPGTEG